MNTKLTLSLDSKVIEHAKKQSKKKGISLSKLIENYLRDLTIGGNPKKKKDSALELIGIAGRVSKGFDDDDELFKILKEKHIK
jgi:hypothetical protein